MTAPPPVPNGQLSPADAVAQWKAFADYTRLALVRAHLIWALVLAGMLGLVTIAGFKAYAWHVNETAKLAQDVKREQLGRDSANVRTDSANARADRWEQRAEVAAAAVRIDTQLVTHVIEAAPKPILVPVTSTAGVVSEVPMIPALSFDSLGRSCTRLEHDCTQALAAKDSALTAKDSALAERAIALAHGDSLIALALKRASDAERSSFFSKILYGVGGAFAGRASCSVK